MAPRPAAPAQSPQAPPNPAEQAAGTVGETDAEHTSPRSGFGALGRIIPKPTTYGGKTDVYLFIFALTNYFRLVALAEAVEMNDEMRILLTGMFLTEHFELFHRKRSETY